MIFKKKVIPELISLHIPKTAGTSFRNILKSVYGDKYVVRFDINEKLEVRLNEYVYSEKELPSAKVIHGHFSFDSLKELFILPEHYKFITWVRDPVQRVVSNFYYLESRLAELLNEEKNNLNILSKMQKSLIEYARTEINRNRQSKFLTGSNLSDFDFIGVQEYFSDEITRLCYVMKWEKVPPVLYHNKTNTEKRTVAPDILEEIGELNSLDIEIYNEALRIRQNFDVSNKNI